MISEDNVINLRNLDKKEYSYDKRHRILHLELN